MRSPVKQNIPKHRQGSTCRCFRLLTDLELAVGLGLVVAAPLYALFASLKHTGNQTI